MELKTGIQGYHEITVTTELTAMVYGSGLMEVFATPAMIALMEKTCQLSVQPALEEGFVTVGVHVNVSHVRATPVGLKVWCESQLLAIDGRKLHFSVKAFDNDGVIGEGTHDRFIVNQDKFMKKLSGNG